MESLFSTMIALLLVSFSCLISTEALTSNNGNITIKWDLMGWTPAGYVAVVTAYNYQKQRSVPGWKMSWRWTRKEVIWSMVGARTTQQGDCSMFKGNIPHSCVHKPTVVDLLPRTPYNQQIANCCKSGVLKPGLESAFQISVGKAGSSVKTARMPANFMFTAPKQQYICGPSKNVRPTRFITADKRRTTTALMTWNITCVFHKAT
ncbi:COBRA plant [Arabidopsis suecica]|uniref:COBRA plant n=1 Tax=Arabidopsis suecica TaxID=45249 RepID=A0A8T2BR84_ARASU|nr:COBRA plant [Arabidopsis suecica]